MKDSYILSIKKIMLLSDVSKATAERIHKAIKETYSIKKVTYLHYKRYYLLE